MEKIMDNIKENLDELKEWILKVARSQQMKSSETHSLALVNKERIDEAMRRIDALSEHLGVNLVRQNEIRAKEKDGVKPRTKA